MSWSHQTNIGYSNGNYFTYGGYGQFVARSTPSQEFFRRLQLPNAKPVLIATVEVGWNLVAGSNLALALGTYTVPNYPLKTVRVNGAGDLPTPPDSGGFFNTYGYNASASGDSMGIQLYFITDNGILANTYVAIFRLSMATAPKTFRSRDWEPRILSAPNLSLRIEPKFGGPIPQIGGGRLVLNNADGYFDKLQDAAWDTGIVTIEYGLDLPDAAMAESDYVTIGNWRVEKAERSDSVLNVDLKELKTRIESEIPFELLNRTDYTAISNEDVGNPVPLAYGHVFGAPAIVLNRATRTLKVALHRIRSFDAVRIRKQLTSAEDVTVAASAFATAQTNVFITNFGDTIKTVTVGGTELTAKTSVALVAATAGTWYQESDLLYIRLPGGAALGDGIVVRREQQYYAWVASSFASTDLQNGEFTLGSDWDRSAEVSVDFQGRVKSDGTLMENWADIVADLLDYLGETRFDAQSFNTSRRELAIGLDQFGLDRVNLAPSFLIRERKSARDLFAQICETAGASLFVDPSGAWRFQVFRPTMVADLANNESNPLRTFTHRDLLDALTKLQDSTQVFSRVSCNYARRHAEDWSENLLQSRSLNKALHAINEIGDETREPLLYLADDAQYFAQRLLTTEGPPIATWQTMLPRSALLLLPGDQIRLTHVRHGFSLPRSYADSGTLGLDGQFEILSIEKDYLAGRCRVVLGDRRGWEDGFGFWLIEDVTTPTLPSDAWLHLRAEGLPFVDGARVDFWQNNPTVAPAGQGAGQFTAANQPTMRLNQINGLPALKFDVSGGPKTLGLAAGIGGWTGGEIFLLIKADNDPGIFGRDSVYHFASAGGVMEYPNAAGVITEGFGLAVLLNTVDPGPALTSWRLWNVSASASALTQRLDGVQIFTTGAHTFGFTTGNPAIGGASTVYGGEDSIAEVLIYPRVLSVGERAAVENYFSTRFNLGFSALSNTPVQWNYNWTNAQAVYARANYGWWHDSLRSVANLSTDPVDARAYLASRWW